MQLKAIKVSSLFLSIVGKAKYMECRSWHFGKSSETLPARLTIGQDYSNFCECIDRKRRL